MNSKLLIQKIQPQYFKDYDIDKDTIQLLEPEPYQNDCFGKYGRHCSYGSWKQGTQVPL
jgi:hypothetical protein